MLARMSALLARVGLVWTTLPCPRCRSVMMLQDEGPLAGEAVAVEHVYRCRDCGHLVTRHWLWAIPD